MQRREILNFPGYHGTDNAGEKHGSSKICERDVREIFDLVVSGYHTQIEIGNMYGITQQQVSRIKNGRRWKCLLGENNG